MKSTCLFMLLLGVFGGGCSVTPVSFEEGVMSDLSDRSRVSPYVEDENRRSYAFDLSYAEAVFEGKDAVTLTFPEDNVVQVNEGEGRMSTKGTELMVKYGGPDEMSAAEYAAAFLTVATIAIAPRQIFNAWSGSKPAGWNEFARAHELLSLPSVSFYKFVDVGEEEALMPLYEEAESLRKMLFNAPSCNVAGWNEEYGYRNSTMWFNDDYHWVAYHCDSPVFEKRVPFNSVNIRVIRGFGDDKSVLSVTSKCTFGTPWENGQGVDTSYCGEPMANEQIDKVGHEVINEITKDWVRVVVKPSDKDKSVMNVVTTYNELDRVFPAPPIFDLDYVEFLKGLN